VHAMSAGTVSDGTTSLASAIAEPEAGTAARD
jgi:hypothetical protein